MQTKPDISAQLVAALYDTDLHAWAMTNARLLREGHYDLVDTKHLIEEIEDMGKGQQHAIASFLRNLLMHLLKWQFTGTDQHLASDGGYVSIARLTPDNGHHSALPPASNL